MGVTYGVMAGEERWLAGDFAAADFAGGRSSLSTGGLRASIPTPKPVGGRRLSLRRDGIPSRGGEDLGLTCGDRRHRSGRLFLPFLGLSVPMSSL